MLLVAALAAGCGTPRPDLVPHRPSAVVQQLRHEIDALLTQPAFEPGTWGILIRSLQRDDVLYTLNARKLLLPASSLKIATLAVAAETLGWEFTFRTELHVVGEVHDGMLGGDLVVIGNGDPSLTLADGSAPQLFASWAETLKQRGIHSIRGRVVGDDNAFDDVGLGAGWMWDDLDDAYSAAIGALQIDSDATTVTVRPGPVVGAPATVELASDGSGLTLDNRVTTAPAGTEPALVLRRARGRPVIELAGTIAVDRSSVERRIAVENPTLHFVAALSRALVSHGIDVQGPAVDIDALADAPRVIVHEPVAIRRSPTLATLAVTLMKTSQNQYAETLLKALGAANANPTFDAGRQVVRGVFGRWGIPETGFALADGSGLSRYNLISAETLTTILSHVYRNDYLRAPFEASLPLAGRDGTLAARMKGTPAEGNVRAKTGSMTNARSIAGYLTTADGEPLVFAILANNYGVPGGMVDEVTDTILARLSALTRPVR